MPNLDFIYDATKAVIQDETNTNKEVIYQPYLPAKFRHIRWILLLFMA